LPPSSGKSRNPYRSEQELLLVRTILPNYTASLPKYSNFAVLCNDRTDCGSARGTVLLITSMIMQVNAGIKSLRATLPDEIFTGDFAS
jgi:hypothetical protein